MGAGDGQNDRAPLQNPYPDRQLSVTNTLDSINSNSCDTASTQCGCIMQPLGSSTRNAPPTVLGQ